MAILETLETCWMCVIEGRWGSDFMKYDTDESLLFCEACGWTLKLRNETARGTGIVAVQAVDGMSEQLIWFMLSLDNHGIRHAYLVGNDYDVLLCAVPLARRPTFWRLSRKYRGMAYFEHDEREMGGLIRSPQIGGRPWNARK